MKLKIHTIFFLICASLVPASITQAQIYEFQFQTTASGFGGEFFFNAPSGTESEGNFLQGNSFITTPDGTFTVSKSVPGGPIFIFPLPPPTVWSPSGITALNVNLYESVNSQLYNWSATANAIADSPVGALPLDPSASGTWVYIGAVPEPGVMLQTTLGAAGLLLWRVRHNSRIRSAGK
jgi:hypothetical protein